ncbi:NgoBV family restriction endonuclease [Lactobacillus gallinarum]|uniref:Restriction endonuclease n=1 Tax=Lactobacillus gallinarum TaxID=52242 RepID=A0A1Y4VYP8_9LACO|nr:NgoBV family restriction endonuclease [Lactobacillus gallinarum]OUQ74518.1 hypothetical protein B5E44_09545 [Lactobacillus gallinarum]
MVHENIQSLDEMEHLLKEDILHKGGNITISIGDIPKISHTRDIIGNCIQEWLPQWFKDNGLDLEPNKSTQTFPDFIAHFANRSEMVDIKCWNYKQSPGFDIANFDSFYSVVYNNPAKLFAKYLTIGYSPTRHGFTIEYVNLLNMWELVGKSAKYPLSLQVKRKRPYAIRPINFSKYPKKAFNDPVALIQAVRAARILFYPEEVHAHTLDSAQTPYTPNEWYEKVYNSIQPLIK